MCPTRGLCTASTSPLDADVASFCRHRACPAQPALTGNSLPCTGRVINVVNFVPQPPTVLLRPLDAPVLSLGLYDEAQPMCSVLWSAPLAFSIAGMDPLVVPLMSGGYHQPVPWPPSLCFSTLAGPPDQSGLGALPLCYCAECLNQHMRTTGPLGSAGSPIDAALAQYAAAAGQAAIPIAVAPDTKYSFPGTMHSPVPSPPTAGPYIGVMGGSASLRHVATAPLSTSPPVSSAPVIPTMIGSMSTELRGTTFGGFSEPGTAGLPLAPGVQVVGTGYVQYPHGSLVPQQFAQVATQALPLATVIPAPATVTPMVPTPATISPMVPSVVVPPPGSVPTSALYQGLPQGSSLVGGNHVGASPLSLHPGAQGTAVPGGLVIEPSPTPIADSVLLGHMLGDYAAPPPDQPLPVVAPLAGTSGVPAEEVSRRSFTSRQWIGCWKQRALRMP